MPEKPGPKRLADRAGIGQGGGFEGIEKIEKKDIEGEEVILVDFRFGPSKYKEGKDFVTVLIEVDGTQRQANIGGQVVVEALKRIEPNKSTELPAPVIFEKDKTKDGKRTFWTMK
jgi:hypothetical protein